MFWVFCVLSAWIENSAKYRQNLCSGLPMVIAVNVGMYGSCLASLACAGTFSESAKRRGEARAGAGRQLRIAHTPATARGCRRGGVAGAEPPHKGGPNRPDRPKLQGPGAGGQELVAAAF